MARSSWDSRGPRRELSLEIDGGDNAPLTLRSARGILRVPRVAFKAAPGRYRILLGNRDAEAPRYDIASLRHEILSYSAVPIEAGPSEANPAFRRRATDLVWGVSPAVLLWGTLGGAVAVLLALTVRLLRADPSAGKGRRATSCPTGSSSASATPSQHSTPRLTGGEGTPAGRQPRREAQG